MASVFGWRALLLVVFLIALIQVSVAPRIRSSRSAWNGGVSYRLNKIRVRSHNADQLGRGGGGAKGAIRHTTVTNSPTSTESTQRSTSTMASSTPKTEVTATGATGRSTTGSGIPTTVSIPPTAVSTPSVTTGPTLTESTMLVSSQTTASSTGSAATSTKSSSESTSLTGNTPTSATSGTEHTSSSATTESATPPTTITLSTLIQSQSSTTATNSGITSGSTVTTGSVSATTAMPTVTGSETTQSTSVPGQTETSSPSTGSTFSMGSTEATTGSNITAPTNTFPPITASGSSLCPGFVQINDHCYSVVNEKHSWLEANDACQLLNANAHLVSLSTDEKREAAKAVIAYMDVDVCSTAWTGGQLSSGSSESAVVIWDSAASILSLPSSYQASDLPQRTSNDAGECLQIQLNHGQTEWGFEDCGVKACAICEVQPIQTPDED